MAISAPVIQAVDKCLDEPHRIVSSDVIVNRLRQEEQLRTVVTGDVCHAEFYRAANHTGISSADFSYGLYNLHTDVMSWLLPFGPSGELEPNRDRVR